MFYQGDLQSGIGQAMQEAKLVGCFVTGTYLLHQFGTVLTGVFHQMVVKSLSSGRMIFFKKDL